MLHDYFTTQGCHPVDRARDAGQVYFFSFGVVASADAGLVVASPVAAAFVFEVSLAPSAGELKPESASVSFSVSSGMSPVLLVRTKL